jgi:hypothetical protein
LISSSGVALRTAMLVRVSDDVEHGTQGDLTQFERNRPGRGGLDPRRGYRGLECFVVDLALQPARVAVHRVFVQQRSQQVACLAEFIAADQVFRVGNHAALAAFRVQFRKACFRAAVLRVVLLYAAIQHRCGVVLSRLPQHLGLRQPLRDGDFALAEILGAVGEVFRFLARGFVQNRERFLAPPRVGELARLFDRGVDGAACEASRRQQRGQQDFYSQSSVGRIHFASPLTGVFLGVPIFREDCASGHCCGP